MTEKQKAFCDYYLESGNATEAYKRVYKGCKKDETARANSSRLLTNANVSEYLKERIKQIEDERIAKPMEVLQYLTKVMRGEEKDQFDLDAPLNERTKAAELLGKRYRLFTEKIEADVNQTVVFKGENELED
ncbi:terminase small subunit [Clostridium felsineum]|uniref:terminase small subunit n=1 Tax=Clostridium felsineum TaxID=36839 RepID=UPI00214D1651|nr:terminase small subunit [Clostridium felsineum]MCR3759172.1 terminase small subunit [Clostridium felsineum]